MPKQYSDHVDDDLHGLGEELITTAARMVRWAPKDHGFTISLAATRLLARLQDNGPTRISDLAIAERCSQPTITNHVKRLEAARLVNRQVDPGDGRAWIISLTKTGEEQLASIRASLGTSLEPYLAAMSRKDRKALREGIAAMRRLMGIQQVSR
jgi:DNA-binding MarR family transcriptional regulator